MCISSVEEQRIAAVGGADAWKYGELTPRGFAKLASAVGLDSTDVFLDAGSGLGRLVIQAAREFGTRRAFGVELARSRHHAALQSLQCEPVNVSCRVTLLEGDCAAQDLWQAHLSSVGVVFVSNLLFDASLNQRLKHCIEQHAPQARAVACLRKWADTLEGYMEPFEVLCETSWTAPILLPTDATWSTARGSKVFIYKRIESQISDHTVMHTAR